MSSTIQEIADRAGVSKATVHRALNNNGRISSATKEKILQIAKELDYAPNDLARSLRSKRSKTIGLILRGMMVGHYYAEILAGIEEVASEAGYVILIACSSDDAVKEEAIIRDFFSRRVDGMIIVPVVDSPKENYTFLQNNGIPFVFIDKYVKGVEADVVTTDSFNGVKQAVHFLVSTGRKRIAYLNGFEGNSVTVLERIEGYKEQVKNENAGYNKVIHTNNFGTDDRLCGYSGIKQFFSCNKEEMLPDALICTNDSLAFGALKALREMGIKVPGDVAVIGNNNDVMTEYVTPMLSTLSQPKREIGRMSMRLLLDRLANPTKEEYSFNRLSLRLLLRDST